MNELVGSQYVTKLVEKNIIEIVPCYMRGRTLNDAFIILDEAQKYNYCSDENVSNKDWFRSKTVVTGDVSQVDLPKDTKSGLIDCLEFVDKIKGVKYLILSHLMLLGIEL